MTLSDRLGKRIARQLYVRAKRQPNWMAWRAKADAFGWHWPWSWRRDGRGDWLDALLLIALGNKWIWR